MFRYAENLHDACMYGNVLPMSKPRHLLVDLRTEPDGRKFWCFGSATLESEGFQNIELLMWGWASAGDDCQGTMAQAFVGIRQHHPDLAGVDVITAGGKLCDWAIETHGRQELLDAWVDVLCPCCRDKATRPNRRARRAAKRKG